MRVSVCHDCGASGKETTFPSRRPIPALLLCEDCILERGRVARLAKAVDSRREYLASTAFFRLAKQRDMFG
jgi:hypothetical protein